MTNKELIKKLKEKNAELKNQQIKKIKKYSSMYLFALFSISTAGILVGLVAFLTPWFPSIAVALTIAFMAIVSILGGALPLLIALAIITMAVMLFPVAAFLWKKHQINNYELSSSFKSLQNSLNQIENEKNNNNAEEKVETECKFRQALLIHDFLENETNSDYGKIKSLLSGYGISTALFYIVDLMKNDKKIPTSQEELDRIRDSVSTQCDSSNQVPEAYYSGLEISEVKKIMDRVETLTDEPLNPRVFSTPSVNTQSSQSPMVSTSLFTKNTNRNLSDDVSTDVADNDAKRNIPYRIF